MELITQRSRSTANSQYGYPDRFPAKCFNLKTSQQGYRQEGYTWSSVDGAVVFKLMRTKTQLELLRQLRQRKGLAKGFTLVELLIVVAIVGILSAVVLPRYIGARSSANAGALIGQAVGQAKECATFIASGGVGSNPNTSNCNTSAGSYTVSWSPAVSGLNCLTTSSGTSTSTRASIAIDSSGVMTCTFS